MTTRLINALWIKRKLRSTIWWHRNFYWSKHVLLLHCLLFTKPSLRLDSDYVSPFLQSLDRRWSGLACTTNREWFTSVRWCWSVPRLSYCNRTKAVARTPVILRGFISCHRREYFWKERFYRRRAHVRLTVTVSAPVRSMYLLAHKFQKDILSWRQRRLSPFIYRRVHKESNIY